MRAIMVVMKVPFIEYGIQLGHNRIWKSIVFTNANTKYERLLSPECNGKL